MAAYPDLIGLAADELRAEVAPALGGRVIRFWLDADPPVDLLAAPPAGAGLDAERVRFAGCYPLAPYSNRIAGAAFRWRGDWVRLRAHPLAEPHALHGFAWRRRFAVVAVAADRLTLAHDHDPDEDWPWPLTVTETLTLAGDGLTLTLEAANPGRTTQPLGLGFHPFFPRRSQAWLRFSAKGLWRARPDRIPEALAPVPRALDFSRGRTPPEDLDLVFEGVSPGAAIAWPALGRGVAIASDARLSRAVVYTPPGRDIVCFEPVSHPTNAINRAGRPGLMRLEPGESRGITLHLRPHELL